MGTIRHTRLTGAANDPAKPGLIGGGDWDAPHDITLVDADIPATIARDAEVDTKVSVAVAALVASSPAALDTLNELAAALGNDPSFATTMTTALSGKQPLDSDLTAIAALTTTAYGRAFLALADAAAARTALALGTLATASSLAHSATTGITANDHHAQAHHAAHEAGGADQVVNATLTGVFTLDTEPQFRGALVFYPFAGTNPTGTGTKNLPPHDASLVLSVPRISMPWPGSIVGTYLRIEAGWTAGTLTAKPTIDGVTQASPNAVISTSAPFVANATAAKGVRTFTAGQGLGLAIVGAAYTPTTDTITAGVWVLHYNQ